MFEVETAFRFKNGVVVQGHFTEAHPALVVGDMLTACYEGAQIGSVRFIGIVNVNFSYNPENPRYLLSVGFDKDYKLLEGTVLSKL